MNAKDKIAEISRLFKRPFQASEVIYFLELVYGNQVKKNTVRSYLARMLAEGFLEVIEHDSKKNYYTLPEEEVIQSITIGARMDLYKDMEDKKKGTFGKRYQCLMLARDLIEMASITKYIFRSTETSVVNDTYNIINSIEVDHQFNLFATMRNITIHCFESDVEIIEETGETLTLKTKRYGKEPSFFPINGWDAVEKLRRNYIHDQLRGIHSEYPIVVSVIITKEDKDTVKLVQESFLQMGEETRHQQNFNENVLKEFDEQLHLIDVMKDDERRKKKEDLDAEEKALKEKISEMQRQMRDIKKKRDNI